MSYLMRSYIMMPVLLSIIAGAARADGTAEPEPDAWDEPDPFCELWLDRAAGYANGEDERPSAWRGAMAYVSRMDAATAARVRACLPLRAIGRDTWAVSTGEPGDPYARAIMTRSTGRWELVVFEDGQTLTYEAPRPASPIGRALDRALDGRPTAIPGAPACGEVRPGQPCAVLTAPIDDRDESQIELVASALRRALGHDWLVVNRTREAIRAGTAGAVSRYDFIAAVWSRQRGARISIRSEYVDARCDVFLTVTPRRR